MQDPHTAYQVGIFDLAVMVQVSEDIFYQVKKEILDKLDIILQKINLQIINYLHPQQEQFSFIELSSFEYELTHLFHYLDRLYASLNSSVSFSSINSKCSLDCHVENQRLAAENENLHRILIDLQNQHSVDMEFHHTLEEQQRSTNQQLSQEITFDKQMGSRSSQQAINLEYLKENLRTLMQEFKGVGKDVKKMLKKYKFQLLESRVQIISKLKDFEFERVKERNSMAPIQTRQQEMHAEEDGEEVLQRINEILSLC